MHHQLHDKDASIKQLEGEVLRCIQEADDIGAQLMGIMRQRDEVLADNARFKAGEMMTCFLYFMQSRTTNHFVCRRLAFHDVRGDCFSQI